MHQLSQKCGATLPDVPWATHTVNPIMNTYVHTPKFLGGGGGGGGYETLTTHPPCTGHMKGSGPVRVSYRGGNWDSPPKVQVQNIYITYREINSEAKSQKKFLGEECPQFHTLLMYRVPPPSRKSPPCDHTPSLHRPHVREVTL